MTCFLVLISVLQLFQSISCEDRRVKYYTNLIETELAKAELYTLPTDAKEYQGNYYSSEEPKDYGYFDFIVIGAGSTGGVLTARLSEINKWKILVLEAGEWENDFTDIPGLYFASRFSKYNWGFNSTPQTSACGACEDHICAFPRGKAVGGSTVINGLIYARGNKRDFDLWSTLVDNGTWTYKDVLPYFKKSEDSYIDGDLGYHGKTGPFEVNYHQPSSPQLEAFLEANVENGRPILDINGKSQMGVTRNQVNTKNGRRISTSTAFIKPIINRCNLHLMKNTYVTKILIDKTNTAYGVQFMYKGIKSIAKVKKDVILSAGVFGSATILMHSGVGPQDELKSKQIHVAENLPVGKNLHDHATFFGLFFRSNYTEKIKNIPDYVKDFLNGVGTYTTPSNLEGIGFIETNNSLIKGAPDIEILCVTSNSTNDLALRAFRIPKATQDFAFKNVNRTTDFAIWIVLLQPRSRGSVTLKSHNVFDYPAIDPQFLSDKENLDIETIYQGIQTMLGMLDSEGFKKKNISVVNVTFPGCEGFKFLSKAFWLCNIRQYTINIYHPAGTCKMGRRREGGVVDNDLRVHGVKQLRIADASVLPFPLSGHPSPAAIMIGEKFADMLKEEYLENVCPNKVFM